MKYRDIEYDNIEQLAYDMLFYEDIKEINMFDPDLGGWVLWYYKKGEPSRMYVKASEVIKGEFPEVLDAD